MLLCQHCEAPDEGRGPLLRGITDYWNWDLKPEKPRYSSPEGPSMFTDAWVSELNFRISFVQI